MTFNEWVFWVFAATAVLPAVGILLSKSIVRMAFLLLFSLAGFAGLYLHLGAGFVGFTQVLVYIGGILILFLFGVMLTVRSDLPIRRRLPALFVFPEVLAGVLVTATIAYLALRGPWATVIVEGRGGGGAGGLREVGAEELGVKLLSTYILPFEAVTVLLLAAMVGATYIARGGGELERGAGKAADRTPPDGAVESSRHGGDGGAGRDVGHREVGG